MALLDGNRELWWKNDKGKLVAKADGGNGPAWEISQCQSGIEVPVLYRVVGRWCAETVFRAEGLTSVDACKQLVALFRANAQAVTVPEDD